MKQDTVKTTTETTTTTPPPETIGARVNTLRVGQRIATHRITTVTHTVKTEEK